MTKKKIGIIVVVCLISFLVIGTTIGKQMLYKNDIQKDMNEVISSYSFVTSYKLEGYLNCKIELVTNTEFDKTTFEEKQNAFRKIYNELNSSVMANIVHHKIKQDTSRLVKEGMVTANYGGKLYSFKLDTLNMKKVDDNKTLGKKTLSDDEIVIKIHTELQKNKNVSDLKQDIEEGYSYIYGKPNQPIDITMVDSFFEKKISEQYKEISEIFDNYLELLRAQGIEPFYNNIYICKTGNKYKSYQLSEDKFELISLKEELNRNTIEENLDILNRYDKRTVTNGTYPSTDEQVWQYCVDRWAYYDKLEGKYSADIHTDDVFNDASAKFGITASEAQSKWYKIDKEKCGLTD